MGVSESAESIAEASEERLFVCESSALNPEVKSRLVFMVEPEDGGTEVAPLKLGPAF